MPITAYGISKLSIENTWRSMSTCMASSIVYSGWPTPLVPTRRQSRVKAPSPPSCNAAWTTRRFKSGGWLCRPGLYLRRRRHRCADPGSQARRDIPCVQRRGRPWPQPAGHHPSHRVGIRTLACRGVPAQTRHGCSMQCSGHVARRAGARLAREDAFSGRHQADVGVDQQSTPHQAPFLNDGSYPETSRRSPPPAHALATSWGIWAALRKAIRAFRTNGIAGLRAGLRPPLSPACHLAATGRTMPMTWR